jgi:hypothetical protein
VFKRLYASMKTTLTGDGETPSTRSTSRVEPERFEEKGVTPSSGTMEADRSPSRERIAVQAYYRWLSRGKPIGTDREDWYEAERQLDPTA